MRFKFGADASKDKHNDAEESYNDASKLKLNYEINSRSPANLRGQPSQYLYRSNEFYSSVRSSAIYSSKITSSQYAQAEDQRFKTRTSKQIMFQKEKEKLKRKTGASLLAKSDLNDLIKNQDKLLIGGKIGKQNQMPTIRKLQRLPSRSSFQSQDVVSIEPTQPAIVNHQLLQPNGTPVELTNTKAVMAYFSDFIKPQYEKIKE